MIRPRRATFPAVSTDAEGLQIGGEQVAWHDVCRLDAYKRDIYVGDFLCLAILSSSGRVFEINEESPGWKEAGDAEWMLRLIAANPGESVAIYPVTRVEEPGQFSIGTDDKF